MPRQLPAHPRTSLVTRRAPPSPRQRRRPHCGLPATARRCFCRTASRTPGSCGPMSSTPSQASVPGGDRADPSAARAEAPALRRLRRRHARGRCRSAPRRPRRDVGRRGRHRCRYPTGVPAGHAPARSRPTARGHGVAARQAARCRGVPRPRGTVVARFTRCRASRKPYSAGIEPTTSTGSSPPAPWGGWPPPCATPSCTRTPAPTPCGAPSLLPGSAHQRRTDPGRRRHGPADRPHPGHRRPPGGKPSNSSCDRSPITSSAHVLSRPRPHHPAAPPQEPARPRSRSWPRGSAR